MNSADVGKAVRQFAGLDDCQIIGANVQNRLDLCVVYKSVRNVLCHDADIAVYKALFLDGFAPALQIAQRVGSISAPLLFGTDDGFLVGEVKVDNFVQALADNGNLPGENGGSRHPLFAAHDHFVQFAQVVRQLLNGTLRGGPAAVRVFTRRTVQQVVNGGDFVRGQQNGGVSLRLVAAVRNHLAADFRVNERCEGAASFLAVNVNALRGESAAVLEQGIAEKSMHGWHSGNQLTQRARGVNSCFDSHFSLLLYFKKIPILRNAFASVSAVTPSGKVIASAKNSPVR